MRARDLAAFPAGKALLEAEDHGDSAMDPGYWWSKKKYHEAGYDKLREDFWERGKGTDRPQSGAIADAGINNTEDARSTERRQSKNIYRRQHTEVVERTPPSLLPACSVTQTPYNGYVTPRSDESRIRRSMIKELCKGATQQRRHKATDKNSDGEQKKSYSQSQNPYVTSSSPRFLHSKSKTAS